MGIGLLVPFLVMSAAVAAEPAHVLLLHSFERDFEPFRTFSAHFRTELAQQLERPLVFHDVALEGARFEGGVEEGPLLDYLSALFASRRLDLVVPLGGPAARFGQRHRQRLFPSTPMLLACVDQRHLRSVALTTNDAVVAVSNAPVRILENMLALLPETTNVAVVLGNSPLEKFWLGEMRRSFLSFTNRVNLAWLNELPFTEMQKRVAALPPHSAIYYAVLTVDAEGVPIEEARALSLLHGVANAPIFGLHDSQMGKGILGGPLMAIEDLSRATAQVAVRILNGEVPSSIQTPVQPPGASVYDWRELRRWGISETRLPPGSRVLFRQPGLWERYRGRIIAVLVLCFGEGALIIVLVVTLLKRRRTEQLLREIEERLSLATAAADVGVWAWDVARNEVWVTTNWRRMFGFPPETVIRYETVFERIHPEDRVAMDRAIQNALKHRVDYASEHRVVLPDNSQRWIAARGRLDPTAGTKRIRMLGVSVDITERKRIEEALQERNHYIDTVLEQAPIGFAVHTIDDGVGRFVSARYEEIYGVRRGTIDSHLTFFEKVWPNHPELREEIRRRVVADMASGDTRRMSWENVPLPLGSGETRYITAMNIPVLDQNLMVSTVQDVTDRVRAEQALRESEELGRATFDQAAAGIAHIGLDGRWLRVNDKFCAIVGYPREELLQLAFQAITHPDDLEADLDQMNQMLSGKTKTYTREKRYFRKDGALVWVNLSCSLVRDSADIPKHFISVVEDITERKQAEAELQQNEERLQLVMEANSEGVWDWNIPSGRAVFSPRYSRMLGYEPEEFATDYASWKNLVHPDDFEAVNKAHSEHIHEHKDFRVELRMRKKSGEWCWILSRGMVVERDAEGRAIRMVGTHQDITARKWAEAALHELSGRLINAQEEERRRLAEELHDGLSQSLALLAVELELFAQNPPAGPDQVGKRLLEFSARTKELSAEVHRLSHGLHPAKLEQLGLASAIGGFCREVQAGGAIAVSFTSRQVPRVLPQDLALCLYRVTQEALQNVVKHSGAQLATVDVAMVNTEIHLSIADNGRGFDPGAKPGTAALGLISMRERVRLVRGRISVESKPGQGTKVSVRVPLAAGTIA
jgi:PAS domain S-box-containing protein